MKPILLVLSLICFVLASVSVKTGRLNLVAMGLAFLVAAQLWPRAGSL